MTTPTWTPMNAADLALALTFEWLVCAEVGEDGSLILQRESDGRRFRVTPAAVVRFDVDSMSPDELRAQMLTLTSKGQPHSWLQFEYEPISLPEPTRKAP